MFFLAVGGLMVPKLNLILALVCRRYLQERGVTDPNFIFAPVLLDSDNPQCRIPEVQALVTKFNLYLMVIAGMLSAVMAPKLGALSDRYGRKKLLAVTGVGLFVTEVATILAYKFPDTVHYNWLLAGAVVDGLCGSFTAGMAITHAYASDCTPPPKRAVAFGYFHACLFSGIALGPLMAAFLVKVTGSLITIFYVALAISSSYFVFVLFFIPESLAMKRQLAAREKFAADGDNVIWDGYTWLWALRKSNFLGPLKILWPTGSGSSGHLRVNLVLLAAVDTTVFGVAMGAATVVVYYTGYRFGWETSGTSAFISIVNACRVSGLVIILPLLNYIFRTRRANRQRRESGFAVPESNSGSDIIDLNIIRASILLEMIGYAGYALAGTGPLFVVSGIIAAFGGIASPTLQSALTKHVPQDRVGQLLGATGLLHALARIICPTIFNLIYASTVGTLPQTVFVALASSFLIAFLASWFIRPNSKSLPP
jgi:MFS family permease